MMCMLLSEKKLHSILMVAPGLGLAMIFFFIRDWQTALVLVSFDIFGAVGQTWWLMKSKDVARAVEQSFLLRHKGVFYKYHERNPARGMASFYPIKKYLN